MNKDELLDYVLHNLEYLPAIGFLWETSDNSEDFFYEIREYDVKHGDKIYNQQPISHVKWRKLIPTEKEELIFPEDFIDQLDGIIYQSHYEPKLYIYWK
jgi:hypothetical protein